MTRREWADIIGPIEPETVRRIDISAEHREVGMTPEGAVIRELTGRRTVTIEIDDHAEDLAPVR
jgi:hypothetical protein